MFTDAFYSSSSDLLADEALLENRLIGQGQPIRSLIIQRMELQIQKKELYHSELMTDIDKQMLLKLFELSINRYSEVRREAQRYLFAILQYYRCSYEFIIDRIVQILDSSGDVDHDQVKVCLLIF
jgi:predicted metal-dependent peptidase